MKYISIAIDGPSGAGKSTLAKSVAKELGYCLCGYRRHLPHHWLLCLQQGRGSQGRGGGGSRCCRRSEVEHDLWS